MAKSSIDNIGGGSAIASAINKFGDKLWFQIIVAFWLIIGPILFIANPFINNYLNKQTNNRESIEKIEQHKTAFENSKQAYAIVKKTMHEYLEKIDCDYMFLIEYHNGNENVMTGIQFCRFDMTIQVNKPDLAYIAHDKFKDDIVARYDILLSNELSDNRLLYYTEAEFDEVDRYFSQQLSTIGAKSYSIINLCDKNNKVFGSLLCVTVGDENKIMRKSEILLCSREIETIFNNINK